MGKRVRGRAIRKSHNEALAASKLTARSGLQRRLHLAAAVLSCYAIVCAFIGRSHPKTELSLGRRVLSAFNHGKMHNYGCMYACGRRETIS